MTQLHLTSKYSGGPGWAALSSAPSFRACARPSLWPERGCHDPVHHICVHVQLHCSRELWSYKYHSCHLHRKRLATCDRRRHKVQVPHQRPADAQSGRWHAIPRRIRTVCGHVDRSQDDAFTEGIPSCLVLRPDDRRTVLNIHERGHLCSLCRSVSLHQRCLNHEMQLSSTGGWRLESHRNCSHSTNNSDPAFVRLYCYWA